MSTTEAGFENPEFVEEAHERRRGQRHAEMADQVEQRSTKEWLQETLESNTKTVPVMGRDFDFQPVGSEETAELMEMLPDDPRGVSLDELPTMVRRMNQVLGEHCVDPEMDAAAFGQLEYEVVEKVFTDLVMGGELSPEQEQQIERFLEE